MVSYPPRCRALASLWRHPTNARAALGLRTSALLRGSGGVLRAGAHWPLKNESGLMLKPILLTLLLNAMPAWAADCGFDAYDRADYAAALKPLTACAKQGNAIAPINLGYLLDLSLGVAQRYRESLPAGPTATLPLGNSGSTRRQPGHHPGESTSPVRNDDRSAGDPRCNGRPAAATHASRAILALV